MSESIEIETCIDVQIDYIACSECDGELDFTLKTDGRDIQITAEPCETCLSDAKELNQ